LVCWLGAVEMMAGRLSIEAICFVVSLHLTTDVVCRRQITTSSSRSATEKTNCNGSRWDVSGEREYVGAGKYWEEGRKGEGDAGEMRSVGMTETGKGEGGERGKKMGLTRDVREGKRWE